MAAEQMQTSEDAVLGGRLVLRQPLKGHRVGHDAILLAAACSARPGDRLVELGAGVGAAGLAVALRVEGVTLTMVEIDPVLVALAHENAASNGLAARTRALQLDVGATSEAFVAAKLPPGGADQVLMNPPFNAAQNPSPDRDRRLAHTAGNDTLGVWLGAAVRLLRTGGTVTLIWRADGLSHVLAAIAPDFGAITMLPIHPKPDAVAIRVLIRAVKASRGPSALLPGLILADAAGRPTAQAEAVLREDAVLPLADV